jgi:hypothetical protein
MQNGMIIPLNKEDKELLLMQPYTTELGYLMFPVYDKKKKITCNYIVCKVDELLPSGISIDETKEWKAI